MADLENYFSLISAEDLDKPIDYKHEQRGQLIPRDLGRIADGMREWKGAVAEALGLTDSDVTNIEGQHQNKPALQKREALKLWKSRRGAREATPRTLIQTFAQIGNRDYIDLVVRILGDANQLSASAAGEQELPGSEVQQHHQQEETDSPVAKWCSFTGAPGQHQSIPVAIEGTQPATLPCDARLWGKPTLTFKFKTDSLLKTWKITENQILLWANKWKGEYIPKFELAKEGEAADILIELNTKRLNCSKCGYTDSAGCGKPTMWLDLSIGDHRYKEHLVVHEFGHALGLGHEHQRSDFWECVKPHIDEEKLKKAVKNRSDDWMEDFELDIEAATDYDSESIMHYWFKKEWLMHGYSDINNIKQGAKKGILSEKVKNALLGVHKRAGNIPIEPSEKDLQFLNNEYAKVTCTVGIDCDEPDTGNFNGQGTSTTSVQKTTSVAPSKTSAEDGFDGLEMVNNCYLDLIKWKAAPDSKIEKIKIYEDSAPSWEKIATRLGLTQARIEIIRDDKRERKIDCVKAVYGEWLNNASGLPNAKDYPLSWQGLIKLLDESELTELAKKVYTAVLSPYNQVKRNFDC